MSTPHSDSIRFQLNLDEIDESWSLHSDSLHLRLDLDEKHVSWLLHSAIPYVFSLIWRKKVNPGHSTQWFRIFSAWFEWETWILITPHSDSVQIRLNKWKRWILITLLHDFVSFLLNLNAKYESWPLTQGFHNFSLIWMWNVRSDHSTQWFRIFCGCRCRASRLTGAGVYTVSPHPRSWRPCKAAR